MKRFLFDLFAIIYILLIPDVLFDALDIDASLFEIRKQLSKEGN